MSVENFGDDGNPPVSVAAAEIGRFMRQIGARPYKRDEWSIRLTDPEREAIVKALRSGGLPYGGEHVALEVEDGSQIHSDKKSLDKWEQWLIKKGFSDPSSSGST